jgi:hypothetical protein
MNEIIYTLMNKIYVLIELNCLIWKLSLCLLEIKSLARKTLFPKL